jgi:hypothetical protein
MMGLFLIDIFCASWIISKHKALEIQLSIVEEWQWFCFKFEITRRRDHAGIDFVIEVPFLYFNINLYDCRHWDYRFNKWIEYEDHFEEVKP